MVVPANKLAAVILADITKTPPLGESQRKQFADIDASGGGVPLRL
jgi:hypothetical protein